MVGQERSDDLGNHKESEKHSFFRSFLLPVATIAIGFAFLTALNIGAGGILAAFPMLRSLLIAVGMVSIALFCILRLKQHWPLSGFEIAQVSVFGGFMLLFAFLYLAREWLESLSGQMQIATIAGLATPLVVSVFLLWAIYLRSEYEAGKAEAQKTVKPAGVVDNEATKEC